MGKTVNDKGRTGSGYPGTPSVRVLSGGGERRFDYRDPAASTDFVTDMWAVFDELGNLLLDKHADYGPSNIAAAPGGPLNGLRVRIHDKVARANHLIDSGADPRNESLRDTFIDLANYAAIAVMVMDGKWPEK